MILRRFRADFMPEGTDNPRNPGRGWYQLAQFMLSEDADAQSCCLPNSDLILLEINLSAYAGAPLGEGALRALDALLARCDIREKWIILRPLYDWSGESWRYEPGDFRLILTHIAQLRPALHAHAAALCAVQGVLVGNWAEMHGSPHLSRLDELISAMADAVPPNVPLAVRTPAAWRACLRANESLSRRLGFFNDALCSSPDDMGTYLPPDAPPDAAGRRAFKDEVDFLDALCRFSPLGGETAQPYAANAPQAFFAALPRLRISYLSGAHHEQVLDSWRNTVYEGKGAFHGKSYYDAIGACLGYRLVLTRAAAHGAALIVQLQNAGCAPPYFQVPVSFIFTRGGEQTEIPVPAHSSEWARGITLSCALPALPAGDYGVYLRLGGIRTANQGAYDEALRANRLGIYTVYDGLKRVLNQSIRKNGDL